MCVLTSVICGTNTFVRLVYIQGVPKLLSYQIFLDNEIYEKISNGCCNNKIYVSGANQVESEWNINPNLDRDQQVALLELVCDAVIILPSLYS